MNKDFLKDSEKNLILIIALIFVVAIVAFIFGGFKNKDLVDITNEQYINKGQEDILKDSFETRKLKIDDKYVVYDIKYPYFFYAGRDFNNKIKDFIQVQAEAHGINGKDNWQSRYDTQMEGDNISLYPKSDDEKYYFFSDFGILQSNSDFISVVMTYGGYNGGAHGYENRMSFAYNLKEKKEVELKDLFVGEDDYLQLLSDITKKYFRDRLEEYVKENLSTENKEIINEYITNSVSMIEEGTKPELKNFSVFGFDSQKIKIYFGQYQIGPYVEGMQEVEISR